MANRTDMTIAHWAAICESFNDTVDEEENDQRTILNSEPTEIKAIVEKAKDFNGALKSKLAISVVADLAKYFEEKTKENKAADKLVDICSTFCREFYHEAFQLAKEQKL